MPFYEFRCSTCQAVFDHRRPMVEADAPAVCPEGHVGAQRLLPVFATTGLATEPVGGRVRRAGRGRLRQRLRLLLTVGLSSWDDYPVHQASELIAHPATSDRNFYDRYYFNMHPSDDDWFAIFGFGQYPNLGVVDAFIDVRRGGSQHVVRSSAPAGRPGRHLRRAFPRRGARAAAAVAFRGRADRGPRGHGRHVGGAHPRRRGTPPTPALQGPARLRHPAAGPDGPMDAERCRWAAPTSPSRPSAAGGRVTAPGACARSASPRPTASARASSSSAACGTTSPCSSTTTPSCTSATSATTASARWCSPSGFGPIRTVGWTTSGAPSTSTTSSRARGSSTTRWCASPKPGIEVTCRPILANFVSVGTGYGMDADWRHGMYHGPETVTQGLVLDVDDIKAGRAVRHRRPPGRVLLRRQGRLRAARARVLRALPALRPDGRRHGGSRRTEPVTSGSGRGRAPRMRQCFMPDASSVLLERLQSAFDTVRPGADPVLRVSDRADFQANGALALAKEVGRTPRQVAEEVVAAASLGDVCSVVEVSGPGFVNLTLSDAFVAGLVARPVGRSEAGRRTGGAIPRRWSWTTRRPTWPRRCTSGTCARRSSATRSPACWASSGTPSSARTTSATGARPSACSSST